MAKKLDKKTVYDPLVGDPDDPFDLLYSEYGNIQNMMAELQQHVARIRTAMSALRSRVWKLKNAKRKRKLGGPTKRRWTKERMIEAVQRFHKEFKRAPSARDFAGIEWMPDATTVQRTWHSLAALREAAGLPPGLKGRGGAGRGGGLPSKLFGGAHSRKESSHG